MDQDQLKAAVKQALAEHGEETRIDSHLHAEHHRIVAEWIELEKLRKERWERMRGSVIGGSILMLIGAIGSFLVWVGQLVLSNIATTGGHPHP